MGVVTQLGAPELAVDRRRMGLEVVIVLGLSLGQSAVYSVLRIIERLTRDVPLAEQTSTLNASITPDRPWLDLTYQLVGIGIGLMPVLLALYLLSLTDPPAGRTIGFDLTRPRFDLGFGFPHRCRHRRTRAWSVRPRPRGRPEHRGTGVRAG